MTERRRRYNRKNLKKQTEYAKQYRLKHPSVEKKMEEFHVLRGLRQFGLTPETYQELLSSQGGRCAICKCTDPKGMGRWHIDHDHLTNKVRGLLCNNCNPALGHFKDDPELLRSAIKYLERFGCTHGLPRKTIEGETPSADVGGESVHVSSIPKGNRERKVKTVNTSCSVEPS